MDPTALLDALVALAVFPGAAFLCVAVLVHRLVAGRPPRSTRPGAIGRGGLLRALTATVATAMLPLDGSPAIRLPAPAGAAGNVVAVIVLLAVAVGLAQCRPGPALLATAAALPVLCLAAAAGSVSVGVVCTAGGGPAVAARTIAAALLVLGACSISATDGGDIVAAALALAAAALVVPGALAGVHPLLGALTCLGMVGLTSALARVRPGLGPRAAGALAAAGAVSATVLALLSSRS